MKKTMIALATVVAMLMTMVMTVTAAATPAFAQGDQTITSDPASVEEAGEYELTVTGSGYSEPAFLLPCPGANGDPAAMDEDSCDTGNLTPVTPDGDGNWEATVTFEIPAEGLVIVAGNVAQTEVGLTAVGVGAMEESTEDSGAMEESMEETAAAEDDSLADTGNEALFVAVIGLTALLAGALFLNSKRDLVQS